MNTGQSSFDEMMPDAFSDATWAHHGETLGYRVPAVRQATGVTYRQLDYWARTELVEPSIRSASGSGSQRLYSFRDIVVVRVVKRLLDAGVSLQNIRSAVEHLRERGAADLASITLVSDGLSVYECTSDDEIIDLLRGGQGVFGIALGRTVTDVAAEVADLAAVSGSIEIANSAIVDELAERRSTRKTA